MHASIPTYYWRKKFQNTQNRLLNSLMKAVSGLLKLVSTQYISVNFPKIGSAKPVALLDHKVPHTTSSSIDTKGPLQTSEDSDISWNRQQRMQVDEISWKSLIETTPLANIIQVLALIRHCPLPSLLKFCTAYSTLLLANQYCLAL